MIQLKLILPFAFLLDLSVSGKYHVRDAAREAYLRSPDPLSYITQNKFIGSSLFFGSHLSLACKGRQDDGRDDAMARELASLAVLKQVAAYATPALRPENSFARLGGPYRVCSSPIRSSAGQ